jgi:hypothetical protein
MHLNGGQWLRILISSQQEKSQPNQEYSAKRKKKPSALSASALLSQTP